MPEGARIELAARVGSGAAGFKDADPTIGTIKDKMVLLGGTDERMAEIIRARDEALSK